MSSKQNGLFEQGQTYGASSATAGDAMLGIEVEFADTDIVNGRLRTKGSRKKRCRLVRNTSGGALLPGQAATISYANALPGLEVGGAAANLDVHVGVVDEWLPAAGVADGDVFWLTIEGPTKVIAKTGATIAAGNDLIPQSGGVVDIVDTTPADATAAQAQALSVFAVALEGVTTAAAGAKILVDLKSHA